jgi:filamentous hemagglutinin
VTETETAATARAATVTETEAAATARASTVADAEAAGGAPRIHMGRQGKHIPGHNNFEPGRSVLTADPEALAPRAGTGTQVRRTPVGQPGSLERVVFDDVIGDYVDKSGAAAPTRVGIIHYSRDGIHIVPARPQ